MPVEHKINLTDETKMKQFKEFISEAKSGYILKFKKFNSNTWEYVTKRQAGWDPVSSDKSDAKIFSKSQADKAMTDDSSLVIEKL
jgi:hypothetical protein